MNKKCNSVCDKMTRVISVLVISLAYFSSAKGGKINPRVIGGADVDISNHPWQISMHLDSGNFWCGGFLISSLWAITAAHCGKFITHVRAGSNRTSSGGIVVGVESILIHPNYSVTTTGTYDSDISLVRLGSEAFGDNVRPVSLPEPDEEVPLDAYFDVTGWGSTNADVSTLSETLQGVSIPTVGAEECGEAYEDLLYPYLTKNMFCGGYLGVGGEAPCKGDSGGPAVLDGKVIGITSWGRGCARGDSPAVFTKVANYVGWIREETGL